MIGASGQNAHWAKPITGRDVSGFFVRVFFWFFVQFHYVLRFSLFFFGF
jgi:hypothetical protein